MNEYRIMECENIKKTGRFAKNQPVLTLFWSGSGIEFNIKASEASLFVNVEYNGSEQWIRIIINDETMVRMPLVRGKYELPLFRSMNPEKIKKVRVINDTQAKTDDESSIVQFISVITDGEITSPPVHKMKLEVIGDSITSGEGTMGNVCEEDWIPMVFSCEETYSRILANRMDADLRIISQSGWGVYSGYDNNMNSVIPPCYETVCGALKSEKYKSLGALDRYDFSEWQPDAVLIFLGTNDENALNSEPWTDPVTGKTYRQCLKADGTVEEKSASNVYRASMDFLRTVRKNNPKAYIIWMHGYFSRKLSNVFRAVVNDFRAETGDSRVEAMELEMLRGEDIGARFHPGKSAHKKLAQQVEDRLKIVLGKNN